MTPRKKLIEVALPLEAINVASAREKSIRHGHPSTLHLWWARRPLAACRAVIFSSLVDDPDDPNAPAEFVEACWALPKGANCLGVDKDGQSNDTARHHLFDFIEKLVQWESTTNEEVLDTARELIMLATGGNPPPLLDPFAGGGSIPLEAQRLGLEAHASDLNPVAVMINKALIEIPPRFANMPPVNPRDREKIGGGQGWKGAQGLAADVRYYGEWMRERAWEQIGHLYPKGPNGETVIAWLWARTVKCPNPACGAQMPLVSSYWLGKKAIRRTWIEAVPDPKLKRIYFNIKQGEGAPKETPKLGRGAQFRCLCCGETAPEQYIYAEGQAGRMGRQMMVIATEGKNGRNYYPANVEHERVSLEASPQWKPDAELAHNPRYMSPPLYGMTSFQDLFTERQLVALTTFSGLVLEVKKRIFADAIANGFVDNGKSLQQGGSGAYAYAEAVSIYLAFGVDRSADYWSTIVVWHSGAKMEGLGHTFSRQAIPMTWDFAEGNPFSDSSGNWINNIEWCSKFLETMTYPVEAGTAIQGDARSADILAGLVISTDPPYYDNIGYSDLADFFYVWLRPILREVYPSIFSTMLIPKEAELVAMAYRFDGDEAAANMNFEHGLKTTFANIRSSTASEFPTSIYYAFKQYESDQQNDSSTQLLSSTGWETMLQSLISAGFTVTGTWPIRTEYTTSLKAKFNVLASSIVLICRPRPSDAPFISRREFVNALRREMPDALRELQSGNIAPVDLAQASIGPGMAIYSRYSKVLEANGEALSVRSALQLINQVLDEYLAESEGDVDSDTRFAINWFEQFGFQEGNFGVADVLARAKNTSVDGLKNAGVLLSGLGKVRLLRWDELEPGWDPSTDRRVTVWEAVHHLIERINSHGESGAALLLLKMSPDLAAEARGLAYRLYSICERKGWAEIARDYNGLVVLWPGLQEAAAEIRRDKPQQLDLFGES